MSDSADSLATAASHFTRMKAAAMMQTCIWLSKFFMITNWSIAKAFRLFPLILSVLGLCVGILYSLPDVNPEMLPAASILTGYLTFAYGYLSYRSAEKLLLALRDDKKLPMGERVKRGVFAWIICSTGFVMSLCYAYAGATAATVWAFLLMFPGAWLFFVLFMPRRLVPVLVGRATAGHRQNVTLTEYAGSQALGSLKGDGDSRDSVEDDLQTSRNEVDNSVGGELDANAQNGLRQRKGAPLAMGGDEGEMASAGDEKRNGVVIMRTVFKYFVYSLVGFLTTVVGGMALAQSLVVALDTPTE